MLWIERIANSRVILVEIFNTKIQRRITLDPFRGNDPGGNKSSIQRLIAG